MGNLREKALEVLDALPRLYLYYLEARFRQPTTKDDPRLKAAHQIKPHDVNAACGIDHTSCRTYDKHATSHQSLATGTPAQTHMSSARDTCSYLKQS